MDLKSEIQELEKTIEENKNTKKNEEGISKIESDIKKSTKKKEGLIAEKINIDEEVINLRVEDIEREVETITKTGVKKKKEYEEAKKIFDSMEEPNYDEEYHNEQVKLERELKVELEKTTSRIDNVVERIKNLEEGEFCSLCSQPLADVDHSGEIKENKDKLKSLKKEYKGVEKNLSQITKIVEKQDELKSSVSEYDRTSLKVDSWV